MQAGRGLLERLMGALLRASSLCRGAKEPLPGAQIPHELGHLLLGVLGPGANTSSLCSIFLYHTQPHGIRDTSLWGCCHTEQRPSECWLRVKDTVQDDDRSPSRICALSLYVRGTPALPGEGHSLSVRKTDTPAGLRSVVWWGRGVPCGGK